MSSYILVKFRLFIIAQRLSSIYRVKNSFRDTLWNSLSIFASTLFLADWSEDYSLVLMTQKYVNNDSPIHFWFINIMTNSHIYIFTDLSCYFRMLYEWHLIQGSNRTCKYGFLTFHAYSYSNIAAKPAFKTSGFVTRLQRYSTTHSAFKERTKKQCIMSSGCQNDQSSTRAVAFSYHFVKFAVDTIYLKFQVCLSPDADKYAALNCVGLIDWSNNFAHVNVELL